MTQSLLNTSLYKGKRVLIVGLSVEGVDVARFFHEIGVDITYADRRTQEDLGETYQILSAYSLANFFLAAATEFSSI